ncbi:MAG: amidohydrolase [Thermoanaerobaculia bacterium]|nr:amidohydrolase [Thermoanaerobaculia bacterium]
MRALILTILFASSLSAQTLDQLADKALPSVVATYKTLHANPELSTKEEKSAALVASKLRELGWEVTERVGKYVDPSLTSYGVVAMMRNGEGPVVLVRSDMDALPVPERTGVDYASKNQGVMHACGHDVHMATLIGTAQMLASLKSQWRGTVMLVGQPAEEVVKGADAMLRDGLYERFARPDYALALHDWATVEAGKIGWRSGYVLANSDSIDITVRGMGGHGAAPHTTRDPIVVAAQIVLALQTLVSRENSPLDPVVITVGSIHGGAKRNIIPDEVKLALTVRTYKTEVRERVLASIERVAKGIALAAGIPENLAPLVEVIRSEAAQATYNDPALTERVVNVIRTKLGEANVVEIDPGMAGEDFGRFGLDRKIPVSLLMVGAADPARIAAGQRLPSLHSSEFAPPPELTLRTGMRAMTVAVMELLRR